MFIYVAAINKDTGNAVAKQFEIPNTVDDVDAYLKEECIEYIDWEYGYSEVKAVVVGFNTEYKRNTIRYCKQCRKYFYLSESELRWYYNKGISYPKRCLACRKENREKRFKEQFGE